jgi:hypothetical protein
LATGKGAARAGFCREIGHGNMERSIVRPKMKRFIIPIGIVIVILVGLALLTEGSAIAPFLYRNF